MNSQLNSWQIPFQYLAMKMLNSDATSNWRVKLWRICSKSPNSPKFPPPKFPSIQYVVGQSVSQSVCQAVENYTKCFIL